MTRSSDQSDIDMLLKDGVLKGPSVGENVDKLADDFEKNWTERSIDRLVAIVDSVENEAERRDLLEELLNMEFELRFKNGLRIDPDEYRKKFPRFEQEIGEAFRRLMESRRFGSYEYYEIIGKGGLGVVYRARHVLLDRIVAIKSLRGDLVSTPDFVNRFLREIRMISRLTHPNIVSAEYADCDRGRYFLVMEYVDGCDLDKIVRKHGPFSLGAAAEIMRQAALGLQHASAREIIHRDIKPGNIMLSGEGTVKILDFGLGKFQNSLKYPDIEHSLTTAGSTMGSVDYIAPEQWEDAVSVTVKADIYSLGCTLFYLMTGKAPFQRENMTGNQKMVAHIKGEIPSLKDYRGDIPDEVESCYRKMVAKTPADRFDEPAEIAEIMERFAGPVDHERLLEELREQGSGTEDTSVFPNKKKGASETGIRPVPPRRNMFPRIVGAVLIPFVFGIAFFSAVPRKDKALPPGPSTKSVSPDVTTTDVEPPSTIPESVRDFVQFTGYSGKWWFEEIPWFLPAARKIVAENAAADEIAAWDDDDFSRKIVADAVGTPNDSLTILLRNLSTGAPPSLRKPLVDAYLRETAEIPAASPDTWHTLAVLLHARVADQTDPSAAERARTFYHRAISGYREKTDETSRLLENLCRFDLAWLEFLLAEDADEFQRELLTIESKGNSPGFRLALTLVPAERQMEAGRHRDKAFEDAFETLTATERKTPLLSWLHRRYAEALTRQWRLTEARPQWKKALEFFVGAGSPLQNPGNGSPDRTDFYFHCRLAEALSDRHTGNLTDARRQYRDLIEELHEAISGTAAGTISGENDPGRPCRPILEASLSRTLESLADCTLFTPAYFAPKPPRSAGYFIEEADDLYEEAKSRARDPDGIFVLQCKRALLAFCNGDFQGAGSFWTEAKRLYGDLPETSGISRTEDYHAMCKAVFSVFESNGTRDPQDGESTVTFRPDARELRGLLDLFRLNSNAFDRYAGEKLDLQLFCIRGLLVESGDAEEKQRQLARNDIERYLDPILLQHLQHECSMRPFLNDCYDLVVRLQDGEDMIKTAEYIRAARCQRRSGTVQNAHLIFYFSPAGGNGFALFLPPEMQNPRRIELEMTRDAVFQHAKSGKPLTLPTELVELVDETLKSNRKLVLSWDDSPCWRRSADRITLNEWPFDGQLDRNRLFGIVK